MTDDGGRVDTWDEHELQQQRIIEDIKTELAARVVNAMYIHGFFDAVEPEIRDEIIAQLVAIVQTEIDKLESK